MHWPSPERASPTETRAQQPSGRLGVYTVGSEARPARQAVKFKCRNCGQKILVDRALHRATITCPTCTQPIAGRRSGRLAWEIGGGLILLLGGFALGRASLENHSPPVPAPVSVIQKNEKPTQLTNEAMPTPRWLAPEPDE